MQNIRIKNWVLGEVRFILIWYQRFLGLEIKILTMTLTERF